MEDYITKYWKHKQTTTFECPHRPNGGIMCDSMSKCDRCGWHPETERERIRQEYRKRHIPIPGEGQLIRLKRCP